VSELEQQNSSGAGRQPPSWSRIAAAALVLVVLALAILAITSGGGSSSTGKLPGGNVDTGGTAPVQVKKISEDDITTPGKIEHGKYVGGLMSFALPASSTKIQIGRHGPIEEVRAIVGNASLRVRVQGQPANLSMSAIGDMYTSQGGSVSDTTWRGLPAVLVVGRQGEAISVMLITVEHERVLFVQTTGANANQQGQLRALVRQVAGSAAVASQT
jgi:hypothetical protein